MSVVSPRVSTWKSRIARRLVQQKLSSISDGRLTVSDPLGEKSFGDKNARDSIHATVTIHDLSAYTRMLSSGSVGAAEGFMDELWSSDDLVALVRIFARNRQLRDNFGKGMALTVWLRRIYQALRRNTRGGSRRNIAEHYDLGNDFFALMLDETMMYSCAIFEHHDTGLADASRAKNDRICRKLDLSPDDHVLEIGSGWGGFAIHAATHYGCRVTTTTISREQHRLATERIRAAGMQDHITVLLSDYRDLHGEYDKVVSIEMIEAVGHQYLDTYFDACSRLLKPHGAMALQGITINEQDYATSRRTVDFVKRYIFPGSCLPSTGSILASIARATDLRITHQENLGAHYVLTLRAWRENFARNIDRVRALGYSERFLRMWEYYLCYCEGAFAERHIGVSQFVFTKPLSRLSLCAPLRQADRRESLQVRLSPV
jgi:cyclopropane-fatty-acyl-phospholipid synthase